MADDPLSKKSIIIYGLADPRSGELRYVGKTSGPIHNRRLAHISDVRRGRTYIPRHKWLASLLAAGIEPEIFEIERISADWQEAESFWIIYFRFIGCDLLNATGGGDGLCSYRHRADTRLKQSAAAKRRYEKPGERERTGEAVRRGQANPEYRAKHKARVSNMSVETRSKLSITAKIHRNTDHAKAATSHRMKGRVVSEQTRQKLSESKLGRKRSQVSIEKQRRTITGRKHSSATIAKMSAARRAYYAARATTV